MFKTTLYLYSVDDDLNENPPGCKIIATLSNGTIKTLCDVKETNPTPFSDSVSEMVSSKLERAGSISPQQRLVQTNLSCSCVLYQVTYLLLIFISYFSY